MSRLDGAMKWIMIVAGGLTCTMFYAALAPQAALRSMFGQALEGPVAEIVVRSWGALIGLVGLVLLQGAFYPAVRRLALSLATISKLVFIGLVMLYGRSLLEHQVGVAVVVDSMMVALFVAYLVRPQAAASRPARPTAG